MSAPSDVGAHLIAPLLPAFLARHPRVRIEVEHTLRVVDLVREGFDLAIRLTLGRLPPSSLIARKLTRMNLALYAGMAYAARRDLPKHPGRSGEARQRRLLSGRNSLALDGPKGIVKVAVAGRAAGNDFFFLREAIAAGVGIGPLPWFLASGELAAGRITRVLPDHRAAGAPWTSGTIGITGPTCARRVTPADADLERELLQAMQDFERSVHSLQTQSTAVVMACSSLRAGRRSFPSHLAWGEAAC